jgi:hypothetical protein
VKLTKFHQEVMLPILGQSSCKFPKKKKLKIDAYDTYINAHHKVFLMDLDPWLPHRLEPLLYSWAELHQGSTMEPSVDTPVEVRVQQSAGPVLPSAALRHRLPFDLTDVSNASAIAEFARAHYQQQ